MAHPKNPATPKHDTPLDPEFLLRTAAMAADLAHAAARRGDARDAASYAVVAAELLGEAHRDLTARPALGVVR